MIQKYMGGKWRVSEKGGRKKEKESVWLSLMHACLLDFAMSEWVYLSGEQL